VFATQVTRVLAARAQAIPEPKDDFVVFAEGLFALEDPRG
jgi:hypothetical protein